MFEAREFLRKKLIGQTVQITVDYIQPANTSASGGEFPEKTCCTVTIGGVNVAEALVSKGLATVVRYAADNDQRSSKYDDLLAAEDKAMKSKKGMHQGKNQKDQTTRRSADVSGDVAKSKQFLPFLQRAGRMQAVVEFIASASRYRLYIPRETCVITFLLSGVSCPRGDRTMPGGVFTEGEPFGNEATAFIKEQIMQKEVEIEVETMDKGGNFIGWCFEGINNMSVQLVEEGFASAFMADRSNYGSQIQVAEDSAKRRKLRRWANYSEEEANKDTIKVDEESEKKESEEERKVNYTKVVVTEVTDDAKVYAQHIDEGPKLEALMKQIRDEFSTNPPLAGAYQPKKGDLCAAKFVDGQWYRAKVEKQSPSGDVAVLYVDYGNRANIPKAKCGSLPGAFVSLPAFAHEYSMALCLLCSDEDYSSQGIKAMREDLLNRELKLNVEYRIGGQEFASFMDSNGEDIGKNLILDGLMLAEKKGGRKLAKLVDSYRDAMESAKKNHLNIWEYGDITADDAREFGAGR
jgi:staphylococcal nuclease domain-containing protein 1